MSKSVVYNCNCMEYMKSLPDKAFDLAVVDPPYGAGFTEGGGCKGWFTKYHQNTEDTEHRNLRGRFDRYNDAEACSQSVQVERERERERERAAVQPVRKSGEHLREVQAGSKPLRFHGGDRWDRYISIQNNGKKIIAWDVAPGEDYFRELFRVSRNQIIWGGNYFALPPTRCFIVWKKLTISESFTMAMAEYAWTSFNKNAKVFEGAPQGRPGDQRFHPCLPGDTLVFFSGEWKRISDVQIGEKNWFGTVIEKTEHDAERMVEITAGGKTVTATWNHPFLIRRGNVIAWCNAEQIKEGDELIRNANIALAEKGMSDTEKTKLVASAWSMTLYGKKTMGRFQKVCRSITKTLTRQTIRLKTSCLLRPLNTSGFTAVAYLTKTVNGSNRVKYAESTNRVHRIIGISRAAGYMEGYVNHVSSKRYARTGKLEFLKVGSVKRLKKQTKVFNLTIDGVPAFDTEIGITHNTQKPVDLYKFCLKHFAQPGDKILDTHLGSGSSRIAAWDMGFDFVGCEIDKTYFELEEKRFEEYTRQTRMEL